MNNADRVRIRHIVDALNSARQFATRRCREDLDQDQMLLFALVHAMQIVGEAASKVSDETRSKYPEVPWAGMIGMRNRLVHAYFDINRDILWTTLTEAAPRLLKQLNHILEQTS